MIERVSIEQYDMRLAELEAEFVRIHGKKMLFSTPDRWIVAERESSSTVKLEFFDAEEDCGC